MAITRPVSSPIIAVVLDCPPSTPKKYRFIGLRTDALYCIRPDTGCPTTIDKRRSRHSRRLPEPPGSIRLHELSIRRWRTTEDCHESAGLYPSNRATAKSTCRQPACLRV